MPTPPLREVVDEVEDLAKVAADPVQGVHDDRVARPGGGEHLLQALAVGGRSPEDEFSTPRIRVLHQERWLLASLGKAAEAVGGLTELAGGSSTSATSGDFLVRGTVSLRRLRNHERDKGLLSSTSTSRGPG
jgi:hypothetical protein